MANRAFRNVEATVSKGIFANVILAGKGSNNAPATAEGDPSNTWYSTLTRTSQGVYTFNTLDSWPNPPNVQINYQLVSVAYTSMAVMTPPVQATAVAPITGVPTGAWQFTLSCYTAGMLTDPVVGDQIALTVFFRNTSVY